MNLFEKVKSFFTKEEEKYNKEIMQKSEFPTEQIEENYGVNYDPFMIYSSTMTLTTTLQNMNSKIRQWRLMSQIPEVDEAIDIIINEIVSFDGIDEPLKINLDDIELSKNIKNKILESFEKINSLIDFNVNGYNLLREFYIDGQINYECIYNDSYKNGLEALLKLSPFNLFRVKDKKTQVIKYFYKYEPSFDLQQDYQHANKIFDSEQILHVDFGRLNTDRTFPISYLDKAIKVVNQLTLIEDSLIIYRITRSPEKRVFYIDVGNLPKTKAEQYVQNLIKKYRQKRVYNIETGQIEGTTKSISILEDFWFPVTANNVGTKVETLTGVSANLEDVADLDYFVNKVYKALNIPIERRKQEAVVNFSNTADIERSELKFYKFIIRLRQAVNNIFLEGMKRDLIYKKVLTYEDWEEIQNKIKFIYNSDNLYALIKKLDTLSMKMDIASNANNLKEDGYLSKMFIWKNIFNFTDEEIKQIKEEIKQEKAEENEDEEDTDDFDAEAGAYENVKKDDKPLNEDKDNG